MALIKCPECGKEISDKAQKCIHCGYPLKSEQLDINITSDEDVKKASKSENNSECSEVKEKKRNKKKIIIPIIAENVHIIKTEAAETFFIILASSLYWVVYRSTTFSKAVFISSIMRTKQISNRIVIYS